MRKIKYYVIGGQYESYCYGGTTSLTEAKRLAKESKEYWDNWQGWHTPMIYRAEDTKVIESCGRITSRDGEPIRIVKDFAQPIC